MNRTGIEYTDYSWNPETGCPHGCWYCYARRMANRLKGRFGYDLYDPFRPTFHEDRLDEPGNVRRPSTIMICTMGDLFAAQIPDGWIRRVTQAALSYPHHRYLWLTKNPVGYSRLRHPLDIPVPAAWWCGATITCARDLYRVQSLARHAPRGANCWVSVEPVMKRVGLTKDVLGDNGIGFVAVGSMTGHGQKWLRTAQIEADLIVEACDELGIPICIKDNLKMPDVPQQTPWPMPKRTSP